MVLVRLLMDFHIIYLPLIYFVHYTRAAFLPTSVIPNALLYTIDEYNGCVLMARGDRCSYTPSALHNVFRWARQQVPSVCNRLRITHCDNVTEYVTNKTF